MKTYISVFLIVFILLFSCNSTKMATETNKPKLENYTIRIANDAIEYEILIIDAGFSGWLNSNARPRDYYSQSFLESRNRVWVLEWNRRVNLPMMYNPNWYEMTIDYQSNIDYGYEVNYMLFNYLTYFQLTKNQKLGVFTTRY